MDRNRPISSDRFVLPVLTFNGALLTAVADGTTPALGLADALAITNGISVIASLQQGVIVKITPTISAAGITGSIAVWSARCLKSQTTPYSSEVRTFSPICTATITSITNQTTAAEGVALGRYCTITSVVNHSGGANNVGVEGSTAQGQSLLVDPMDAHEVAIQITTPSGSTQVFYSTINR